MRIAVIALVVAGCYQPTLEPCTVRCRLTFDCPPGMGCGDDKFCHASTSEAMCPCIPLKCSDVRDACGDMPDTCGGTVQCGGCEEPNTCGGAGLANICGNPANCQAVACEPNACGPSTDSCGNARDCGDCPPGKACRNGTCTPCTPNCLGELACGDDGCGRSCGECPDPKYVCDGSPGLCCIPNGERCQPLLEGCNCCEGLFCISGFCTPASGCNEASPAGYDPDVFECTGEIEIIRP